MMRIGFQQCVSCGRITRLEVAVVRWFGAGTLGGPAEQSLCNDLASLKSAIEAVKFEARCDARLSREYLVACRSVKIEAAVGGACIGHRSEA